MRRGTSCPMQSLLHCEGTKQNLPPMVSQSMVKVKDKKNNVHKISGDV